MGDRVTDREVRIQLDKAKFVAWLARAELPKALELHEEKVFKAVEDIGFSGVFDELDEEAMQVLSRDGRDMTGILGTAETVQEVLEWLDLKEEEPKQK
eukprot:gene52170-62676_t